MNKERIRLLRDVIASLPEQRFNISYFAIDTTENRFNSEVRGEEVLHDCGTAACIAGWTNALFSPEKFSSYEREAEIGALLGLDPDTAHQLFYPRVTSFEWSMIKPQHAAMVLDDLLLTGRVTWEDRQDDIFPS